jgi:hypothetical protein
MAAAAHGDEQQQCCGRYHHSGHAKIAPCRAWRQKTLFAASARIIPSQWKGKRRESWVADYTQPQPSPKDESGPIVAIWGVFLLPPRAEGADWVFGEK